MTAIETLSRPENNDSTGTDLRAGDETAPDDFSVDEVLRRLSPEEWFPTLRTDIPLWCF